MKFSMKQTQETTKAFEFAITTMQRNGLTVYAEQLLPTMQVFAAARVGGEESVEVTDFVPFAEEEKK